MGDSDAGQGNEEMSNEPTPRGKSKLNDAMKAVEELRAYHEARHKIEWDQEIVALATDMASFNNISVDEVAERLKVPKLGR